MNRSRGVATFAGCVALSVVGCFQSTTPGDAGDGGAHRDGDVARRDGASSDGDNPTGDAGMCEPLGTVRLCGEYCRLPCVHSACHEYFSVCTVGGGDPRGRELCGISLNGGEPHCYSGRICVASERYRPDDASWQGACVDEEYCRWVREQPELDYLRCRYSEGTLFENGPPDDACAPGAFPMDPFCGRACGDTCPDYLDDYGSCVGISETRGFGVCVPDGYHRCFPGNLDNPLSSCSRSLLALGVTEENECACMTLSPTAIEEYADHGWAVSRQSCLAYKARYPDEVRCFDSEWTEL